MIAARKTIIAVGLAAAAAGLGFACGSSATTKKPTSSLPPAGSPQDDGTGLFARWSVASAELGAGLGAGSGAANPGYGSSRYGGATYGMYGVSLDGGAQGGNSYGGSLYANYRFNANFTTTHSYTSPPPATPPTLAYPVDYSQTQIGIIHGIVKWPTPPKAANSLPPSDSCADSRKNDTLAIGRDKRVADAVVFIEDIKEGLGKGRSAQAPIGGILEHVNCSFRPHVQIMGPIGTALRITSSDEGARAIRVTPHTDDKGAEKLAFEGVRRGQTVRRAVSRAGTYRVDTENDASATAWVIVPKHPYYTVTDDDGTFRLDRVPPGSYTLVVWHPPVITGFRSDGTPKLTKPFVAKKTIKVTAKKSSSVTLKLPSGR